MPDYLTQAGSRQFKVPLGSPSCLLFERVENIVAFREARDVDYSVLSARVDAYLVDSYPDGRERLPVIRVAPHLDQPELVSRHTSRVGREGLQISFGCSRPKDALLDGAELYTYLNSQSREGSDEVASPRAAAAPRAAERGRYPSPRLGVATE